MPVGGRQLRPPPFQCVGGIRNPVRGWIQKSPGSKRFGPGLHNSAQIGLGIRRRWRNGRNVSNSSVVLISKPDMEIETEPCVDGRTRITADFVYPSELDSRILLYIEDSPEPMVREPTLDKGIYCDHDYRVFGQRAFEGESSSTGTIWVPVATKEVLVKVFYALKHHQGEWVSPPVETVLEVWDAPDIESLYGTRKFYCDKPGGDEVDSVDEIAHRRSSLLSDEQKAGFGPYDDAERNEAAWADGDGDGSICNGGELGEGGDGEIIKWIELSVYPSTQ